VARHVAGAADDGLVGGVECVPERAGLTEGELCCDLADEVRSRLLSPWCTAVPASSAAGQGDGDERRGGENDGVFRRRWMEMSFYLRLVYRIAKQRSLKRDISA
jgi:hypothetical protein